MKKRQTAREIELKAAATPPSPPARPRPLTGEAVAMLARRGLQTRPAPRDLPFPADLADEAADRLSDHLGHYGFRLFLRGAIQKAHGFTPEEATRYLSAAQARALAEAFVDLELAVLVTEGRYRLRHPARSFGGTLEWYVGRELRRRFGFDVATGLKVRAPGIGGDLDVIAAAEGKLLYLELKSSPPKHLSATEVAAFLDRMGALRPDLTVFVMDTALRLGDKVLPMLAGELEGRLAPATIEPRRVRREVWELIPHLYAVNAKPDLLGNIARAVAEWLRALSPPPP